MRLRNRRLSRAGVPRDERSVVHRMKTSEVVDAQIRLDKWKRGVDRDLNRYYELNPQELPMKAVWTPKTV